jgi:hypothetical protein
MDTVSPFAKATGNRGEKWPALTCFLSPGKGHMTEFLCRFCLGLETGGFHRSPLIP